MKDRSIEPDLEERTLQAFHDGELGWLARWRFERRLARSAELRSELQTLESVSELVRAGAVASPAPDLWSQIAGRLPAIDAERAESAWEERRRSSSFLLPWKPFSALAAAGAVAALAIALFSGETVVGGVVHWVDSGDRSVMVLDGERDVTVIWVFDSVPKGAARGGGRESA